MSSEFYIQTHAPLPGYLAGYAAVGAYYYDISASIYYQNTGTQANPVWSYIATIPTGTVLLNTVETIAVVTATAFDSVTQVVSVLGYTTIGIGAQTIRRVTSEPAHPGKYRSLDRYLPNGTINNTNGGWWELYTDTNVVQPEMFGGIADGVTDNYTAITNMIAYIEYYNDGFHSAKIAAGFQTGSYYCTQQLNSYYSCRYFCYQAPMVEGQGSTLITFPAGVSGWRIHNYPTGGGGSPQFENIWLRAATGQTPAFIHGWVVERSAFFINCAAWNFPGNGFHFNGATDGAGFDHVVGFNDFTRVTGCSGSYNGYNGFYCYGADANIMLFECNSAIGNKQFGFRSDGFLGNLFVLNHASGNGGAYQTPPPIVTHGGESWVVVPKYENFTLTNPAITTPGTDATVWSRYAGAAAGPVQAWVNGTNYQAGGGYCIFDNSRGIGNYNEDGQGPNYLTSGTWLGSADANGYFFGIQNAFNPGTARNGPGANFAIGANPDVSGSEDISVSMCRPSGTSNKLCLTMGGSVSGTWTYEMNGADGLQFYNVQIGASTGFPTYWVIGNNSQYTLGTDAATVKGVLAFPKFGLGVQGAGNPTAGIQIDCKDVTWSSGKVGKGWLRVNLSPNSAGSPLVWRTTTSGTIGSGAVTETLYGSAVPIYPSTTVASLPAATVVGARCFVTDANATTYLSIVAAGGANKVPVVWNGTNWVIG
jgi:hypothetical protein